MFSKKNQKRIFISFAILVLPLSLLLLGDAVGKSNDNRKKTDSLKDVRIQISKSLVRGAIVYKNYCILCHGETGDGRGRGAKLHRKENLAITGRNKNKKYLHDIIRFGGESLGQSPFMPVWQDELSDEQIADVVEYLLVIKSSIQRGEAVFNSNCILCHGIHADGKGRASVLFNPPPSDLTRSDKNEDYKKMIVAYGGTAMGRSDGMPKWGEQLSKQEIDDVVKYLDTVLREN